MSSCAVTSLKEKKNHRISILTGNVEWTFAYMSAHSTLPVSPANL